ncbi:MAG TPA: hypothetical protein DCQ98_16165 [Planctomycetaceae bacterium]|nr:hypothetical protein [Planctomycetaceae bacterium]
MLAQRSDDVDREPARGIVMSRHRRVAEGPKRGSSSPRGRSGQQRDHRAMLAGLPVVVDRIRAVEGRGEGEGRSGKDEPASTPQHDPVRFALGRSSLRWSVRSDRRFVSHASALITSRPDATKAEPK